jgi:hypothetical protein
MKDRWLLFGILAVVISYCGSRAYLAFFAREIPRRFATFIPNAVPSKGGFYRVPLQWAKIYGWLFTVACAFFMGLAIVAYIRG